MELPLNQQDMERVIEALLFTSSEPLSIKDLKRNIYKISEIEHLVKSNSKNSLNLVSDFIVSL